MSNSDLISVGALVVALISLLYAVKSYFIAKKSFTISEIEHKDKNNEAIGYLIKSFKWRINNKEYSSFAVSYTNNASAPNSFKEIFLEIEYYDKKRIFNKAKLTPETKISPPELKSDYKPLSIPINMNPKETISGWITFMLPTSEENKIKIDTYRLIATSISGKSTTLESHVMQSAI